MNWDKFWKYATNTAKTIYILFLIGIGIKLLLWLIFSFIPYKPFSPFETFDWNPVATIVGAILTLTGTCIAVVWTSKLDRDARLYEINYNFFRKQLFALNDTLTFVSQFNAILRKDMHNFLKYGTIGENNLFNYTPIENFINVYDLINRTNHKFAEKIKDCKAQLDTLFELRQYFCIKVMLHKEFISSHDENFKCKFIEDIENTGTIHFSVDELLASFKADKNKDYNPLYTDECIIKIRDNITEQFKLKD